MNNYLNFREDKFSKGQKLNFASTNFCESAVFKSSRGFLFANDYFLAMWNINFVAWYSLWQFRQTKKGKNNV